MLCLYLLSFFTFVLCITLLHKDKAQLFPAEIGKTINATPKTENVSDVVGASSITTGSTDSSFEVSVRNFYNFFLIHEFYLWKMFSFFYYH